MLFTCMLKLIPKSGEKMEIALLILSILLIALALLQGNKASDAGQIITGGNIELFQAQKERGVELFISRLTFVLGGAFMIIAFLIMFTA